MALLYALQALKLWLRGRKTRMFTDNQNVPRVQRKGSAVLALAKVAKLLFELCRTEKLELTIEWPPRDLTTPADELSKVPDADDWRLNPKFFA